MLIEFSVENYRSIKEKVTFSLLATKDDSLPNNLIKSDAIKDESLLKSAVIYGANASGKTNVLLALNFLKLLVINSHNHQKGMNIKFQPFKLDKKWISLPTKLEIVFIKNGIKYIYGVSFNNKKVIEEYLYHYPNNKKAIIFERKDTSNYKFTIDEKQQDFIAKRTLDNMLYLSKATQENYGGTSNAFEWFTHDLQVVGPTDHPELTEYTAKMLSKDVKLKKLILNALLEADMGIDDILVETKKISIDELPKGMPEKLKELMRDSKVNDFESTIIKTSHKGVPFDFYQEESEGTKRIFSLIGPWLDALENGRILVVDELDTKLHHLLNVFLINLFQNPIQNKKNAQLIFTTHNVNLLDLELFRRDQIWFTEKKEEDNSTDLYSLMEYSPRKDKNIQKGYLAGRYGALPFIRGDKIL